MREVAAHELRIAGPAPRSVDDVGEGDRDGPDTGRAPVRREPRGTGGGRRRGEDHLVGALRRGDRIRGIDVGSSRGRDVDLGEADVDVRLDLRAEHARRREDRANLDGVDPDRAAVVARVVGRRGGDRGGRVEQDERGAVARHLGRVAGERDRGEARAPNGDRRAERRRSPRGTQLDLSLVRRREHHSNGHTRVRERSGRGHRDGDLGRAARADLREEAVRDRPVVHLGLGGRDAAEHEVVVPQKSLDQRGLRTAHARPDGRAVRTPAEIDDRRSIRGAVGEDEETLDGVISGAGARDPRVRARNPGPGRPPGQAVTSEQGRHRSRERHSRRIGGRDDRVCAGASDRAREKHDHDRDAVSVAHPSESIEAGGYLGLPPPGPAPLVMYALGRTLQLFGLILLPAALLYGLSSDNPRAVGIEISALALGGLCFVLGTRLQARK